MPRKTIKEWLQELPEPYRTEALKNCTSPDKEVEMLSDAIISGFIWNKTKEGEGYWDHLFLKLFSEGK